MQPTDREAALAGQARLPVGTLPDGFDGIPLDGEQYLAMVRQEASSHPHVMLAADYVPADTNANAESVVLDSVAQTPSGIPSAYWRTVFRERFRRLRHAIASTPRGSLAPRTVKIPHGRDEARWYAFIHGRPLPTGQERKEMQVLLYGALEDDIDAEEEEYATPDEASEGKEDDSVIPAEDDTNTVSMETEDPLQLENPLTQLGYRLREPTLPLLRRLTADDTLHLLQHLRRWLAHPLATAGRVDESPLPPAIHPIYTRWMFFLLASLDVRLSGEQIAALRFLARTCMGCIQTSREHTKRSSFIPGEGSESGAATVLRQEAGAWMLIAVVADGWAQHDLWHEAQARLGS